MKYFLVNPNSSSGFGKNIWLSVKKELDFRGISYQAHLTEYAGHAALLAKQLTKKEYPVELIVIGGDGTLNEVLNGISDFSKVLLGYIPTGSGNDFARGCRLPKKVSDCLDYLLENPYSRSIDVGVCKSQEKSFRFGVSCGMGFDAAICQEALVSPVKKVLNRFHAGKLTYAFLAVKQLLLCRPADVKVRLDNDRNYSFSRVYFISVMNQPCEGGGVRFCPSARDDDGFLDVCIVSGISRLKFLLLLPTAFRGGHIFFKGVHIFRCKSIQIHSTSPLPLHRDGESGGMQSDLQVGLEKTTLKIASPVL